MMLRLDEARQRANGLRLAAAFSRFPEWESIRQYGPAQDALLKALEETNGDDWETAVRFVETVINLLLRERIRIALRVVD